MDSSRRPSVSRDLPPKGKNCPTGGWSWGGGWGGPLWHCIVWLWQAHHCRVPFQPPGGLLSGSAGRHLFLLVNKLYNSYCAGFYTLDKDYFWISVYFISGNCSFILRRILYFRQRIFPDFYVLNFQTLLLVFNSSEKLNRLPWLRLLLLVTYKERPRVWWGNITRPIFNNSEKVWQWKMLNFFDNF